MSIWLEFAKTITIHYKCMYIADPEIFENAKSIPTNGEYV